MNDAVAHCSDGRLQAEQTFVVTKIEYRGTSAGDSNGPGEFLLVVAGEVIAHSWTRTYPPWVFGAGGSRYSRAQKRTSIWKSRTRAPGMLLSPVI